MLFTFLSSDSYPFFTKDNNRLGGIYKKAKFVAYTTDSFITKAPEDPLMGLLGPVIRAEVGDIINVTLRNNLLSQNVSITPHGVMYTKNNEGDAYNDGTTGESFRIFLGCSLVQGSLRKHRPALNSRTA